MKRYSSIVAGPPAEPPWPGMRLDPDGLYFFAPDAQKEIDRLRALVRAAYIEGAAADARAEIEAVDILGILWDNSRAKKEME